MTRSDQRWALITFYPLHLSLPVLREWPVHMSHANLNPAPLAWVWTGEPLQDRAPPLWPLVPSPSLKAERHSWPVQEHVASKPTRILNLLAKPVTYSPFRKKDKPLHSHELFSVGSTTDDYRIVRLFPQVANPNWSQLHFLTRTSETCPSDWLNVDLGD